MESNAISENDVSSSSTGHKQKLIEDEIDIVINEKTVPKRQMVAKDSSSDTQIADEKKK